MTLKVDQQHRNIGRIDTGEPGGLAEGCRTEAQQHLTCLGSETGNRSDIEVIRYAPRFHLAHAIGCLLLFLDVATVFRVDLDLFHDIGLQRRNIQHLAQLIVADARPTQQTLAAQGCAIGPIPA